MDIEAKRIALIHGVISRISGGISHDGMDGIPMNMDDVLRLAVRCGLVTAGNREGAYAEAIERFAALVAQHIAAAPAPDVQPVAWLYEDTLPPEYPLELMFPYSKVDFVRLYPVFMPQPAADVQELVEALKLMVQTAWDCDDIKMLDCALPKARAALAKWEGK